MYSFNSEFVLKVLIILNTGEIYVIYFYFGMFILLKNKYIVYTYLKCPKLEPSENFSTTFLVLACFNTMTNNIQTTLKKTEVNDFLCIFLYFY